KRRVTMSTPCQSNDVLAQAADIPAVDRLLKQAGIVALIEQHGHQLVTQQLRQMLNQLRQLALAQQLPLAQLEPVALVERFSAQLSAHVQPKLRPMINLTVTVLHTNLGRALLPDEAIQSVVTA